MPLPLPSAAPATVCTDWAAKPFAALDFGMGADDADGADGCGPASSGDRWLAVEVMYIVRVRARPSFLNSISTPALRRKVAARRSRPDNARGLSGQVLEL